jgi:hypothetical protein
MRETTLQPAVVVGLPRKHDDRVTAATTIIDSMDGNASFPNSATQVAAAKAAVAPYAKAVQDAKNRIPGATKVRKDAFKALVKTLDALRIVAQIAVDATPSQAATLATEAGMKLRRATLRTKADFAVVDGPNSGSVHLIAKAIAKAVLYYWEVSSDQKSWSVAAETTKANAILTGLTPGQTYWFRFRVRTRKGMSDYSILLSYIVR